jgi:ribose transport system ATP-binding protein
MVGRDIDDLYGRAQREPGAVRLEVTGLRSADGTVGPVDLQVRAGEVVSLVGLVGAGRTEIARLVYGADRAAAGTVRVDGTPYERRSPRRSLAVGVALLPEDRKDQALFMEMSVTANVAVSTLSSWRTGLLLLPRRVAAGVAAITGPLRLKAASGRTEVRVLSGGNQQKVVLARMLAQHPHVLILDEPTRGVDIGAKSEIYRIVDEAAAQGTAVLVISSDLPEALGISDRVLVVRGGVVVAELSAAEADEETVMEYATGVAAAAPSPLEESR